MLSQTNPKKIVVFTGAGISAESGLQTFRDSDGLWNNYQLEEVATPKAWAIHPEVVLAFYNERRKQAFEAQPNAAHKAVAKLEEQYEVIVITQNVDDLHERAGSTQVIHVHGELKYARSSKYDSPLFLYDKGKAIQFGDICDNGSQLRPHIVWFGEHIHHYELSKKHLETASKILVVGTSLLVYPAAHILEGASIDAEKIIVTQQLDKTPPGYELRKGNAAALVPNIVDGWLNNGKAAI
ncbi:SIR2 family NAD-dependent protein deacylase [Marinagarivorans algicola]|uniref:SIR2 family NAD-dependent protein deacylase n=1 Tax=Marinagarivorans algicola TaxID=1513270 RepID=UPI0006B48F39|nr:Sir2 family NAD-dependent protein deacetylase [Marinagarivorans algicola]